MSTFFRTAAMSLLSKTLQTFLYKYLSDVDVEGVALPSLQGQQHWGVRLSNVKLRDGAKLLNFPGKRRRRRRRKRQRKERNNNTILDQGASSRSLRNLQSMASVAEETEELEDVAVGNEPGCLSRPSTKKQSSWFGWYYGSSKKGLAPHAIAECEEIPLEKKEDANDRELIVQDTSSVQVVDSLLGDSGDNSERYIPAASVEDDYAQDNISVLDDEKLEQEEEEVPLILRLGEDGRIGVLDVRLVGKSIHVLVEDATLTLEITPPSTEEAEAPVEGKKEPTHKAPPPPATPKEIKTVGDRVIAENAIARVFSALPNLLLRDIHIRVIVRGGSSIATHGNDIEEDDVVLDFGIELLSVTDGEDFLANFRAAATENASDAEEDSEASSTSSSSESEVFPSLAGTNNFDIKRIRTGRGPEGGLTVRLFSGSDAKRYAELERPGPLWARQSWRRTTQDCVLRISGLDIHSRIFLGENEGVAADDNLFFDDFSVDTMLFGGVDYIAPGPKPPLPPMEADEVAPIAQPWTVPGATQFETDTNGIQRCGVESNFHRVARGLRPQPCHEDHLPCNNCERCWANDPCISTSHKLDRSTPMGGVVLHASLRDTLELNVDRRSLETLGLLLDLFRKAEAPAKEDVPQAVETSTGLKESSERTLPDESQRSLRSFFSRHSTEVEDLSQSELFSRSTSRLTEDNTTITTNGLSAHKEENLSSSFPSYYQPEKIQIIGLHVAQIRIRFQVVRVGDNFDDRFSFCYWDLRANCLTMDWQRLAAEQHPFQDVRLDVGFLALEDFSGVTNSPLLNLGTENDEDEWDARSVETAISRESNCERSPWPSTASVLMDLPPPLETFNYRDRERHALQARYLSVTTPHLEKDKVWSSALVRVGVGNVDMPWEKKTAVTSAVGESLSIIRRRQQEKSDSTEVNEAKIQAAPLGETKQSEKCLKYKLKFDGGRVKMNPLFDVALPATTFKGEHSSLAGFSIETFLAHAEVRFKKPAPVTARHGLSLEQLADLPEHVRLRVLLFLSDLKALELALGIKPETNSFLRCRSVNKGIVKIAERMSSRRKARSARRKSRQSIIDELSKLSDKELEMILESHHQALGE